MIPPWRDGRLSISQDTAPHRVRIRKAKPDGWADMIHTIRDIAEANDLHPHLTVEERHIVVSFDDDEDAAIFRLSWPGESL